MPEIITMILPYIIPILGIFVVYYLKKWLNITIEKDKVEAILYAIVNIITNVEPLAKSGLEKQQIVVREVTQGFPDKDKSLLKKVFGTIDVAVEKAFQISHLARKVKKIL